VRGECSVTPHGHRVTVYWDSRRMLKGEEWDESISKGLLHSLCVIPLLSYGATAPLACISKNDSSAATSKAEIQPSGVHWLRGDETDPEDGMLKVCFCKSL
jgi:hypothetical protein